MNRKFLVLLCALIVSGSSMADVTSVATDGHKLKVGDKQQRSHLKASPRLPNTGEQALTDLSGFEYFINTDITFSTSSSASGAASEASYAAPVNVTTAMNGTVSTTLSDAFDGYNSLCVSTDGATGPCDSTGGGLRGIGTTTMYNETAWRHSMRPAATARSFTQFRRSAVWPCSAKCLSPPTTSSLAGRTSSRTRRAQRSRCR
ncbi:MAG: hypothetical protein IPK97_18875 [Ahniella sp.]|nr:hypothetical protein [Ahniella sp.]